MKYNHFHFSISSNTRQRGIGFFGFLIGIVVGIAVALAVAVYITKVPTPFTDKSGVKTQEEQAAEQERAKNWNPNAALAGGAVEAPNQTGQAKPPVPLTPEEQAAVDAQNANTQAAQADADANNTAEPVLPGWEGTTDNSMTEQAAADREQMLAQARAEAKAKLEADARKQAQAQAKAEAQANASADPIDSLVQAQGQATNAPATRQQAASGFIYFVQVGAFREASGAEHQKARVSMLGMQARVNHRKRAGRNIYRVRLGPFQNKAQADAARRKLQSGGMDTALVRVQR